VGKDGLVLEAIKPGKKDPNAIIDADAPNTGDGLTILSPGVKVQGLYFRNGMDNAIVIRASFAHIDGVNIQNPKDDCIRLEDGATDTVIENSFLGNCDDALYSSSSAPSHRTEFVNNTVHICDSGCIELDGEDIVIRDNTISQSEDGHCIEGDGAGWTVQRNELLNCADACIRVYGDDALIADNDVQMCEGTGGHGVDVDGDLAVVHNNTVTAAGGWGIRHYGENPRITNNHVSATGHEGIKVFCAWECGSALVSGNLAELAADDEPAFDIDASAPGMMVENNTGRYSADEGFDVFTSPDAADTITVRNNLALGNGGDQNEEGFRIFGKGHQVIGNTARNNSTGFRIEGPDIVLQGNVARDNYADGFVIKGQNVTVSANISQNQSGEGIEITAESEGAVVTGNTAKNNLRADFCDDGINTSVSDNQFGTVGPCVVSP
jgi:hypothetical protein